VRPVEALRICSGGTAPLAERTEVLVERIVTVEVEYADRYVLSCTPGDEEPLAAGFALSEGLISGRDDILHIGTRGDDASSVLLRLRDPARVAPGRNLLATSSCGLCGVRNILPFLSGEVSCGRTLRVGTPRLLALAREMRSRQLLFARTGAAHAAALFRAQGEFLSVAEDIGRHNALDKAIGRLLLSGEPIPGCGALLSGRVSFEIVAKAARAGIEIVAGISAPSSLAVEVAQRCGITLCGFVREDRLTIYAHPERIPEAVP
jgi:FdhD protein